MEVRKKMRRIRSLDFELEPSAVCIGKFDGIHRGHRLLIQAAKKTKLPVVMFTFESTRQNGIYSQAEKEDLAEKAGVDIFISVPVTEAFRHMAPGGICGASAGTEVSCKGNIYWNRFLLRP